MHNTCDQKVSLNLCGQIHTVVARRRVPPMQPVAIVHRPDGSHTSRRGIDEKDGKRAGRREVSYSRMLEKTGDREKSQ